MILENFKQSVFNAYTNISFSPEKRADWVISEYSQELENDIELLNKKEKNTERYIETYKKYFSAWIAAKSRTVSWMITGPAKFPTARNERSLKIEDSKYQVFRRVRELMLCSLLKEKKENISIEKEIEDIATELEKMELNHLKMKLAIKN